MYTEVRVWFRMLQALICAMVICVGCNGPRDPFNVPGTDVARLMKGVGSPEAYEVELPEGPEFGLGAPKVTSSHYKLYYVAQNKAVECNENKVVSASEIDPALKRMILTPLLKKGSVSYDEVTAYLEYDNERRQRSVIGPVRDLQERDRSGGSN